MSKEILNKREIIAIVRQETGVTEAVANKVYKSIFKSIRAGVLEGKQVRVADFGTFFMTEVAPRKIKNPKTSITADFPARMRPKFRPSKAVFPGGSKDEDDDQSEIY